MKKKLKIKTAINNDLEKHSEKFIQYYGIPIPSLLEKYLKLSKYKSIIDCGCGDGVLLYSLMRNGYLKNKVINAIDLSKKRLENVKKLNGSVNARVDSAEKLRTVRDGSIDFFISTQVIEHVDDKKMLNSIYRVLKKNGTAYVTTVFKKWYGWYFYRRKGKWVLDVTHLREYEREDELLKLIDDKRFIILEMQKHLIWFPVMDFVLRRLSISNNKFFVNNIVLQQIRKISVPIIGYYDWEIVFKKK
jgi:2-polyprenyl-3-methyl-5-hydroxy-6-metoxy-1,4-benzoquinol methylase